MQAIKPLSPSVRSSTHVIQDSNGLQTWIARLDHRVYAALIGTVIGGLGGILGLLVTLAGPLIAIGAVLGTLAGLYILTNLTAALYGIVLVMALLPFGTFPFDILITPTLLDGAMGAFLLVYILQWMRGERAGKGGLRLTPVHALILLYMGWLIFSFVLGIRFGRPTTANLRQFAETLLSISMTFFLIDLLRDSRMLRRLVLVIFVGVGAQAIIALTLYALPDQTAERTLIRLAVLGYPDGGVIRYIEDNPADNERAIGTFVDPNVLGGFLAIAAVTIAPQVFSRQPVLRRRELSWIVLGIVVVALILTFSRAAMMGFAIGIAFLGCFKGYRKFHGVLALGLVTLLILPQTRDYIDRFVQGFAGQDLATQMRIGEYGDALELIVQYPLTGVGFTGTPSADLYTDVASMYLIMANQIGLIGVVLFAVTMLSVFAYAARAWPTLRDDETLRAIFLGYHAALVTALVTATADLYYFRLDFHASITLFWLVVGLALATSRLALDRTAAHNAEALP